MVGITHKDADVLLKVAFEMIGAESALRSQIKDAVGPMKQGLQAQMKVLKKDHSKEFSDLYTEPFKKAKEAQRQLAQQQRQDANMWKKVASLENRLSPEVFEKVRQEYNKLRPAMVDVQSQVETLGDAHHNVMKDVNNDLKKNREEFPAWALSVMFFGMAMRSAFDTIWRSSTKTFNDVMHSIEGNVTGFDMLSGSIDYLKFNVGQALEPIAMWLVPIIDYVAEWAMQNEGLVRAIVLGFGVGGTALMALGMVVTSLNGILTAAAKVAAWDWASIGSTIQKNIGNIAGSIAIFYALEEAKDAYKNFEDGSVVKGMISALSTGLTGYGGIKLLTNKKGGPVLIAIGVGLDLVEEGKFLTTLVSIFGVLFALVETFIDGIKDRFSSGFIDAVKKGIAQAIHAVPDALKTIIGLGKYRNSSQEEIQKMLGVSEVGTFDFWEEFKKNYQAGVDRAKEADKNISKFLEFTPTPSSVGPSTGGVQQYGDNFYIGDIKIEIREGETAADAFNRIMQTTMQYK